MTRFEATTRDDEAGRLLEVRGEVDLVSADDLVAAADEAIGAQSDASCRIDLSGVTFIDSTGVGALITIRNGVLKKGGRLHLVAASRHVRRTLELTGLSETFGVDGDRGR